MELSRRGADLTLSARRGDELEKVSRALARAPRIIPLDASDEGAVNQAAQSSGPFDSVIFLAAIYNPGLIENIRIEDAKLTVDINIHGALNTINAVYPAMREAGKGQIVLCGSVAGYCGLPNSQPYSMTKAAIINLAQSLKVEAERHNIDVKLINPGFVRTPLTDKNDFNMPMIVEPVDAARIIADGLVRSRFEIHFPAKFTRLVKLLSIMPYGPYFKISRNILKKKAFKN
jgi:short-subunit dehydrogenase